jgi:hypothetical protein
MNIQPFPLTISNGPPDLTVNVVPARNWIYSGSMPNMPQDSSTVTITVQNRLSFLPSSPVEAPEPILPVFGSDAKGVLISIGLTSGLRQVGNMTAPSGFQSAVAPNNQTVFFFGGTIPAGASADFVIEVIGDEGGCVSHASILAEVDPYSFITEVSKTNNKGSATILIVSLC